MADKTVMINEKNIDLTRKEFSILQYLMLNSDRVISAEELIEHAWDSEKDLFSDSLKFHIYSLRKKLKNASDGRQFIINLRGQGYKITRG